ncbi:hypothetical protein JTB14_009594 [Gonioctena quinquepunctata]|nr:hypothetical protein JTB14_009594 [Gonioctena quinquepunctata]
MKVEDSDREFNIMKNSKLRNPDLIILILSAPGNLVKRKTIRETWLKLTPQTESKTNEERFKTKHYFVIGSLGLNNEQIEQSRTEQLQFKDILMLPMYDSYKNMTYKVKQSFEWLDEQFDYGLGFRYVLKCDDDSFVNLNISHRANRIEKMYINSEKDTFLRLMEGKQSTTTVNVQTNNKAERNNLNLYWGYFSGGARIKTKGKWKERDWIASDRYIPYALGGGYLLSKSLISYIAKNAENLRSFNAEDVSVGLWLISVNNILRIHDVRFDTEWTSRGCKNSHLISHKHIS